MTTLLLLTLLFTQPACLSVDSDYPTTLSWEPALVTDVVFVALQDIREDGDMDYWTCIAEDVCCFAQDPAVAEENTYLYDFAWLVRDEDGTFGRDSDGVTRTAGFYGVCP